MFNVFMKRMQILWGGKSTNPDLTGWIWMVYKLKLHNEITKQYP